MKTRHLPSPLKAATICLLAGWLAMPPSPAQTVISEFMAANSQTLSIGDTTPDWIELHNPGITEANLTGWHLTDNVDDLNQWTFPEGTVIAPGAYLLVYASGDVSPAAEGEIHTSFRLAEAGEYLALVRPDSVVEQEFAPTYPEQYNDISYGTSPVDGSAGYFQSPTPGDANSESVIGFVKDTTFSHKRGFYETAFQLEVTSGTLGASIRYTTDGSTPDDTSPVVDALDAKSPPVLSLTIDQTTIVRARAEKTDFESTNTDTQTYMFLDDIIASPNMSTAITQHPTWGPQMRDALLEIPSISLVTQEDIPTTPIMSPPEIPVSIEMIFPDGSDGFQYDAGAERFGGQFTLYPKHALRISFKEIYGPKKLKFDLFSDTPYGGDTAVESFDQILLRNGSHDSIFSHHYTHSRATYIRNRYFFDRQIEAGHLSMRGKFVHVYLNGDYYGQFHLMERPNADFMATHLGGEEEDYDIMKGRSGIFVSQGNGDAWGQLTSNLSDYDIVQDYLDLDSYIDYMLLNFYGGNEHDWYPQHNWVAGRKREPGGKFKFFMWDNDFLVRRGGNTTTGSTANTTDNGGPGNMLNALSQHEEFKVRLADRAQMHFFNGGMLTKERVKADFTELAKRVSRTVIPEAARWAAEAQAYDSRNSFYTPSLFQSYVDWIVDINAESRTDVVITQMRNAGLFPDLAAPTFNQHGGEVAPDFGLVITNDSGQIYYTTDGSDPRLPGGELSPTAIEFIGFTAITPESDWKYYDSGDLGTEWREVDYDDSTWASGPAPLGFGAINTTPVATTVNASFPRDLTFYCRRTFEITGASSIIDAYLQVNSDGGAVVHINGIEAARDNMPAGTIDFLTRSDGDGNEGVFDTIAFDHTLLVEGTNTIAVEVHNSSTGSSDMVIDIGLFGTMPLPINSTTTVRARTFDGDEWSAITEATFLAGVPAAPENLVVSEIHYHPSDAQGELAEFIELMNISDMEVDLAGVAFTNGITFSFEDEASLAPGQRGVLVADVTAFESAFGTSANVLGNYDSRLSDGGERLTLSTADGSVLQTLRYNDNSPWPTEPDGLGYSLVLIGPESAPAHELPENWRASLSLGGNPGTSDAIPFAGDPATDLLTYAIGEFSNVSVHLVDGVPTLEFPKVIGADDVTLSIEVSDDLVTWRAGEAELLSQSERVDGTTIMQWSFSPAAGSLQYARLVVSLNE